MTAIVQVILLVGTLALVGFAIRTAWLDHVEKSQPHEVLHRYEGRPHEGFYFAEFDNRTQAQEYLWKLAAQDGVTEAHIVPMT